MAKSLALAAIALVLVFGAIRASPDKRPVVLKAARLFDGGSDSLVAPGVVVVRGTIIEGAGANVQIPTDGEVIDLGDATLLPGFMDAHTHLTSDYPVDFKQAELDN